MQILVNTMAIAAENKTAQILSLCLELVAGLVLFLYGVSRLSDSLKEIAAEKLKTILARFTVNRFTGVLTGTATTTLLDSSSVTIIMVIALVNAGLLSFEQSLGVIMGSNIGTTISSQLIAFKVNEYAAVALALGFGMYFISKTEKVKHIGMAVMGLGLVFFGLNVMGEAVEPLKENKTLIQFLLRMENPLLGALAGAFFTVVIQSSSATMGIIITLASQRMLTLPAGIAIMLGAEIGTCADTLMATIGRSREAKRAGIFHLLFNVLSVAIGIILANQLADFTIWISEKATIARQIANAHMLFNVAGVLLFIWFTPQLSKLLNIMLPDRQDSRILAKKE
jgi:phosphate:Na+ symporter